MFWILLMEDDSNVNINLKSLAMNLKMEICGGSFTIISFLDKTQWERELPISCCPCCQILDIKVWDYYFFFIDCEQDMIIKYSIFN